MAIFLERVYELLNTMLRVATTLSGYLKVLKSTFSCLKQMDYL